MTKSHWRGTFPNGPVVKNLPSNVGEVGSIPSWETRIPCVKEQLNPRETLAKNKINKNLFFFFQ